MSTSNWYVSANGSTWNTCASLGISRPRLTLRANGLDELQFDVDGDFLASDAFAYGTTLHLSYGVTDNGNTTYTTRFIGRVNTIPRQATSNSETMQYQVHGGWWWLEEIDYCQTWQILNNTTHQLVNTTLPRVVLGQSDSGAARTMGQEIAAAIDWAIARGAPIAKGTIDYLATCPSSEHTNITVAQVIRQVIQLQPDTVCYFDYSTGTPVFHCRAASNLTPVNVAALQTDMDSISMVPRYDLQLPGITINYEITTTVDGASWKSISTDSAGNPPDARSANVIYPMSGAQIETATQAITIDTYPVDTASKTFWRTHIPWLSDIADGDLTISNVTRSGSKSLGGYLLTGQIVSWMGVDSEEETWTAEIDYVSKTSGSIDSSVESRKVSFRLLSCGGTSKTYRTTLSYTAAETPPNGLAAALYASWGRLHWDGQFRLTEEEVTFQVRPCNTCNITGGLSAWSSMVALVPEVVYDIEAGTSSVTTGTFGRLQADTLVAFWRGVNARKFSTNRISRTDASAAAGVVIGASGGRVLNSVDGDPGRQRRAIFRAVSSEGYTQTVDINPAGVAHAASGDSTARVLQPREILIPYQSGGSIVGKLCQVLGSDLYGTEVAIGGPAANPGGSVSTFGASSLGAESASAAADWVAGGANGVALWVECRQRYYSAGTRTWYAYARKLVFDSTGKLYSVSGNETRIIVEVPEV
jgi:hypothetical protein